MDILPFSLSTSLQQQRRVLTIGNFDGIHPGHQQLIKQVAKTASELNALAAILTFNPHPLAVLGGKIPPLITTQDHKWLLLEALGVQQVWQIPFTPQLAAMDAAAFVEQILHQHFNPLKVLVGQDFRFGHQRQGSADMLSRLGQAVGFAVEVIPSMRFQQHALGSSVIRSEIAASHFSQAAQLLGRPYSILGGVQAGSKRGRMLGFPTMNLHLESPIALSQGVFASHIYLHNQCYQGICNHGSRPTFQQQEIILEAHLFDFSQNCYGETIEIVPRQFLRPERHFSSAENLANQLLTDCQQAKQILTKLPPLPLTCPFFPAPTPPNDSHA